MGIDTSNIPVIPALEAMGLPYQMSGCEVVTRCTDPACGDTKKHLYIRNVDGGPAYCQRCGRKTNLLGIAKDVYGVSNGREAEKLLREALGTVGYSYSYSHKETPVYKQAELVDVRKRDLAYEALLDRLTLDDTHKEDLQKRGFSLKHVLSDLCYKSTPRKSDSRDIMLNVQREADVVGTPGFFTKNGEPKMSVTHRGILIPYRDRHKRIQMFQIRVDNEIIKREEERGKVAPKYLYFSSSWVNNPAKDYGENGCGVKTAVHYASEFLWNEETGEHDVVLAHRDTGTLRGIAVTEGALKADLAHQYTGYPYLAVPGVNALNPLKEELLFCKEQGISHVFDCFDMDFMSNQNVRKASDRLREITESVGLTYSRSTWNRRYKGIDDYVLAKHIAQGGEIPE